MIYVAFISTYISVSDVNLWVYLTLKLFVSLLFGSKCPDGTIYEWMNEYVWKLNKFFKTIWSHSIFRSHFSDIIHPRAADSGIYFCWSKKTKTKLANAVNLIRVKRQGFRCALCTYIGHPHATHKQQYAMINSHTHTRKNDEKLDNMIQKRVDDVLAVSFICSVRTCVTASALCTQIRMYAGTPRLLCVICVNDRMNALTL